MADHNEDDVDAGAKISESGFGESRRGPTDDEVNQAQLDKEARLKALKDKLDEELRTAMRKNLNEAIAELDAGTLHGLVMVRVNDDHDTAATVALCNMATREVAAKLQEIHMDLVLPAGAAREIRGLIELLGSLGRARN